MNLIELVGRFIKTDRELVRGDIILVIERELIGGGMDLLNNKCYVVRLDEDGDACVIDEVGDELYINEEVDHLGYLLLVRPNQEIDKPTEAIEEPEGAIITKNKTSIKERFNRMDEKKKRAIKHSTIWGLFSFSTGASINLLSIFATGELPIQNIISIVICAAIGIACSVSIYKLTTK